MRFLLLMILFHRPAFAVIKTEGDEILPFQRIDYPLKELIKDYADALKVTVSYPEDLLISEKSKVNLFINEKTKFLHFASLIKSILDSRGYTLIQENGFQWIAETRDTRYIPTPFYTDKKIPNDESYVTSLFRLKYPIASSITRNLRPFMTRYGRIINFADGRSIVIQDKGDNILKLFETISFMDTEKVYQDTLIVKQKKETAENEPTNQKIVELEIKNKILESKIINQDLGVKNEATNSSNNSDQ